MYMSIIKIIIRVRNAGASGRECSALAGRHYLPPRQAGFTSFLTKKSNCNPLEDVASPHWAKTSLSSTLRIISSKEDGSPCLVIADEDLTLDFEAGTPGTSNHGAGVRCFISAHEKIFRIDLWAKTRSSGVARMRERRGGPALLRKRHCAPSGGEKTINNHSQKNCMWNSITSFYIRYEVPVKVSIKDTMTRIVNFKYCPLCKTYFCDDCFRL